MSSVYRDPTSPTQPDEEPLPPFRGKVTVLGVALELMLRLVPLGLVIGLSSDRLGALKEGAVLLLPAYGLAGIFFLLERPVGRWYARRYARRVERGIRELESKVS